MSISPIEPEYIVQLRESLRRFVAKEMPRSKAAEWDKTNHFPRDVFDKLGQLGVMGLTVPEEYGGVGRDIIATMIVIEELSKRSMAVAVPYIMSACYAGMNMVESASDEQKQRFLPGIAAGKIMFAYGWTEPDVGADLASVRTTAERVGDKIIVNGEKRFCSGAAISDFIFTLVRSGDRDARYKNLSFVLIPPNAPGVTVTGIDAMGMKGAATTDVVFQDVEVPIDMLVGGEAGWNNGWTMITGAGLDVEKLEVAAMSIGIAQAALDDAWDYAHQRRQFGKPVSNYQSIQHKLAKMDADIEMARRYLYHASALANAHIPCARETSIAKLQASEIAKVVTQESMTIHGAYGYVKEFDIERYVREALLMPIIGGSSAIQLNNIYKAMARVRASGQV